MAGQAVALRPGVSCSSLRTFTHAPQVSLVVMRVARGSERGTRTHQ
jgi:hypothetical protein